MKSKKNIKDITETLDIFRYFVLVRYGDISESEVSRYVNTLINEYIKYEEEERILKEG